MDRIFCLETEWRQDVQDLKEKSMAHSILEFYESTLGKQFVFRQVATLEDFEYYIQHLEYPTYKNYDVVYLCFHGSRGKIHFANKTDYKLSDFAAQHEGIFSGKTVIFDSCSTLNLSEKQIAEFKSLTGARMIIGYTKSVNLVGSFVFEIWLLNMLASHPQYGPKRLFDAAENEMPTHVEKLGFVCY